MKIDFNTEICELDGKALTDADGTLTLKRLALNALLGTLSDARGQPEQLTGVQKVEHATLAQRIFTANGPLDVKAEEITLLKERIGRAYGPLPVMRAWAILDPAPLEG